MKEDNKVCEKWTKFVRTYITGIELNLDVYLLIFIIYFKFLKMKNILNFFSVFFSVFLVTVTYRYSYCKSTESTGWKVTKVPKVPVLYRSGKYRYFFTFRYLPVPSTGTCPCCPFCRVPYLRIFYVKYSKSCTFTECLRNFEK